MTISSRLNFGRPVPPRRGSAAGRNFWAPPYYSQRAVFASPLSVFFHSNFTIQKKYNLLLLVRIISIFYFNANYGLITNSNLMG